MPNEKIDKAVDKAQDAVGKFLDDPEKVAKAKGKAESFLGKHMDAEQADQVVNKAEELLDMFSHHSSEDRS